MRKIVGCTVSAARWRGVWATSFWMFNRHGCGAIRIRAATTSTKPDMQAKCSGLCFAKKTTREKERERRKLVECTHLLPGHFPLVVDRKNPKTTKKFAQPKNLFCFCLHQVVRNERHTRKTPDCLTNMCPTQVVALSSACDSWKSPPQLVVKSNV